MISVVMGLLTSGRDHFGGLKAVWWTFMYFVAVCDVRCCTGTSVVCPNVQHFEMNGVKCFKFDVPLLHPTRHTRVLVPVSYLFMSPLPFPGCTRAPLLA